jgi:pSer/pThr/pTyr-binding forkhead associated (FHA) protein
VAKITVFGANKQVQDHIGTRGVVVEILPFRVGRLSATVSATEESVHLQFPESRPYFMSRRHFSIERNGPELLVRDSGSHSGTLVNGVAIGARAPSDTARLAPGRNDVVAGREDSPFRFIVVVETADPARS